MPQKDVDNWVRQKVIKPLPEDDFAKDDYEASPIIVIKNPKYIVKQENTSTGVLSDLPTWKPPKSFDGWRSPVTGKKDSTGIADRMASEETKRKAAPKSASGASVSVAKTGTAEQRAAAKKAPPGKRLVRTAEGAERYGVPIGSPIPELATETDDPRITSTVLLSAVMSESDLIAFYNQCHDENGRFCEGDDGPGRVRENGPASGKFLFDKKVKVKTVADAGLIGDVEVDGIKAKKVYSATARNGDEIKLYDKSGKVGRRADEMLANHVKLHDQYPLQPPRSIIVEAATEGVMAAIFGESVVPESTFAIVYGNQPHTYVNADMLGIDVDRFSDGFQMPSAKTGNTKNMDYLLTHEYGHHVDFARHSNRGYNYDKHPLWNVPEFQNNMSKYGKSDARGIEAYSEAFAEWHHSGGKTKNPSAIAMARYEGWAGAEGLRASGEEVSLQHQSLVHFAEKKGPKGIVVIDTLSEQGPQVIGDFEVKEPTQAEIARAKQIMAEVLKELGLDTEGDGANE
jgi:hypothetical protein